MNYIFVSADSVYFNSYVRALVGSAIKSKNNIWVNVINPDTNSYNIIYELQSKMNDKVDIEIKVTSSIYNTASMTNLTKKVFYACDRFIQAAKILDADKLDFDSLWIADIDMILNDNLKSLDVNLGIFLRENHNLGHNPIEKIGMKMMAGLLYVDVDAKKFLEDAVKKMFRSNFSYWFADQKALYESFKKFENTLDFVDLYGTNLMDWNFSERKSITWQGKGDRKYKDPKYRKRVDKMERKYQQILKGK